MNFAGANEGANHQIKDISVWVLGQSVVHGSNFPPVGHFTNSVQMAVAMETCAFFLYALDRMAYRRGDDRLREAVFDTTANQMVRTFSDMMFEAWAASPLETIEQDCRDLFNIRQSEYGGALRLIGEEFRDLDSASWLAAQNIGHAAEFGDIRVMVIHTGLVESLIAMDLANRIKRVEQHLS